MVSEQSDIDTNLLPQLPAVYIPFKTLLTAITSFAQELPPKLDRSAWTSFSNLLRGQTLNSFKFLGLVDKDGYVQPVLKEMVNEQLGTPKFKSILADVLRARYEKIMHLASQHGTLSQLQESMRSYNVSGTTLDRAIRFWLASAEFSGIPYPSHWKKGKGTGTKKRRVAPIAHEPEASREPPSDNPKPAGAIQGYVKTVNLQGGAGNVTLTVQVNPLELTGRNRAWFFELIDKLRECPGEQAKMNFENSIRWM